MAVDPNSRDFLIHYARVMLREAKVRRGQNVQWMIDAAAKARRQAMCARPAQGELFA
jgi:hypothetical protein